MDATDEEEIKNNLNVLNSEKTDTMNFMNKQVSILTENFNLLTEPLSVLQENQKNISNYLKKLVPQLEKLGERVGNNRLLIDLELQLEAIMGNLDNVVNCLNRFIVIYSSLVEHQLPIELIESETLTKIFKQLTIDENLNKQLAKKEIVFELAEVRWTQLEQVLLYKIELPTEISEELRISRIVNYPISQKDEFIIQEIPKHLLLWSDYHKLFLTEEQFLIGCKPLRSFAVQRLSLCDSGSIHPLESRIAHSPINIPVINNLVVKDLPEFKIKLSAPNTYLVYFQKIQTIFSICNGKTWESDLEGPGIFTLNSSCVHSLHNTLIPTQKKPSFNLPRSKTNLNIEIHNFTITTDNPLKNIKPLEFNSSLDFKGYFGKIKDNFEKLNTEAEKLQNDKMTSILTYGGVSMNTLSILIIIIVIIYFCIKNRAGTDNNVNIRIRDIDTPMPNRRRENV